MKNGKKVVAIVQARAGSQRLSGKVLRPLVGRPMLARVLERVKEAQTIDMLAVATTVVPEDDSVAELAHACGASVFRGDEKDVLDRLCKTAQETSADIVVRLTGDCPLHDPAVIDVVVRRFLESDVEYMTGPINYPEGLDTEVFSFSALKRAWNEARLPSEREHVTPYLRNHPDLFRVGAEWTEGEGDYSSMHWSVDTEEDFQFVTEVYKALYREGSIFHKDDILALLKQKPELLDINAGGTGHEGYTKSLMEDEAFKRTHGV